MEVLTRSRVSQVVVDIVVILDRVATEYPEVRSKTAEFNVDQCGAVAGLHDCFTSWLIGLQKAGNSLNGSAPPFEPEFCRAERLRAKNRAVGFVRAGLCWPPTFRGVCIEKCAAVGNGEEDPLPQPLPRQEKY